MIDNDGTWTVQPPELTPNDLVVAEAAETIREKLEDEPRLTPAQVVGLSDDGNRVLRKSDVPRTWLTLGDKLDQATRDQLLAMAKQVI